MDKTILNEVLGQIPLETSLVLGLTAPIVGILNKEKAIDTLFLHFSGNSTQGKTTAIRLAVSPFGYPSTKENGLIKTWNATSNAVTVNLKDNQGVPIAIDEASMHDNKDFSNLIYRIAAGQDKLRLRTEGSKIKQGEWNTTVLSTSESSILDNSNQNAGLKVRVLEFNNVIWTKSAENADALKDGLLNNYGHAGIIFVKYLMKIGKEKIISTWEEWTDKCFSKIHEKDSFSKRVAQKLGIVMATAELAKSALELALDIDGILQFIMSNENRDSQTRDIGNNAYNYFMSMFAIHKSKFVKSYVGNKKSIPENKSIEVWGRYEIEKDGAGNEKISEIMIIPEKLQEIMKEYNFTNIKVILNEWEKKCILDRDKDKPTRKRRIHKELDTRVYVIKIQQEDECNN